MLTYLIIPVVAPGKEGDEEKIVDTRILPAAIQSYQPGQDSGVFVYIASGHVFFTILNLGQFEYHLKSYWVGVQNGAKKSPLVKI